MQIDQVTRLYVGHPSPGMKALRVGVASMALMAGLTGIAQSQVVEDEPTTVVVTAQKREQNLKDVPIVVTTLSSRVLQDAGVRDIKDMQILVPGLTVSSTQNESITTARIRGVGTVGDNPGLESSVGVVIDGVYRPRNGVGFQDLGEMDRIEVLKGPQGTLFGKNTSAGVINVITKKPSFTFGAEGEATFGNYGAQGYAASVTGPLTEEVAGRLYVAKRSRDGFTDVRTGAGPRTLTSDQDQDFSTVRGQLLFVPNDNVDIRVIGDYTAREENCCVAVQTRVGPTAAAINGVSGGAGIGLTANPEDRIAYSNRDTRQKVRDGGVSVEANVKLPNFMDSTLTMVTGIRDWKSTNGQDLDYTAADILYRPDNGDFNAQFSTFSQEVRLAGQSGNVNWLVGGFYAKEDLNRNDSYYFGGAYTPFLSLLLSQGTDPAMVQKLTSPNGNPAMGIGFPAGSAARDQYTQSAESWAIFTNNSVRIDAFEVTMGLRYTKETKDISAIYTNGANSLPCSAAQQRYGAAMMGSTANPLWNGLINSGQALTALGGLCNFWSNSAFNNRRVEDSQSDSDFSGTLKAAWHVNDNIMTYVSYARGYKAGGYNLDRATTGIAASNDLWFDSEKVDSYEIGLKSVLADGALTFNITAFDQRYTDFQLNTFIGTAFVVESIPELTSKGFDADIYWRTPIQGLSIQGGVSYADTKYGDFTAADLNNSTRFPQLSLLPGAQMSFAPKWTASTAFTWTGEVAGLRTTANLTARYTDEYNTGSDLVPFKMQEAYTLVNGRIGIGPQDRKWTLEIWGQNLTDVTYSQVIINAPLQGQGFQTSLQTGGSHPGTFYNAGLDTNTYDAFLGAPKTYGMTLRVRY